MPELTVNAGRHAGIQRRIHAIRPVPDLPQYSTREPARIRRGPVAYTPRLVRTTSAGQEDVVISGAHMIIYSKDAVADRAFFRDVLGFASVEAGDGWLIFTLPPTEAAFHPAGGNDRHELYLMC